MSGLSAVDLLFWDTFIYLLVIALVLCVYAAGDS